MYTRCPHCTTIFRITAEQLRSTHGTVPCVTCTQPFNALESLSDDITTLIAAPVATAPTTPDTVEETAPADGESHVDDADEFDIESSDVGSDTDDQTGPMPLGHKDVEDTEDGGIPDDADTQTALQSTGDIGSDEHTVDADAVVADSEEDTESHAASDLSDIDQDHGHDGDGDGDDNSGNDEPEEEDAGAAAEDAEDLAEPANDEPPAESMEFDAPEQTWTRFFLASDAIASLEHTNQEPTLEAEPDNASPATEFDDDPVNQPWIGGDDTGSFESQTADQNEWQRFLAELDNDESTPTAEDENQNLLTIEAPDSSDDADPAPDEPPDDAFAAAEPRDEVEPSIVLPWLADDTADELSEQRRRVRPSRRVLGTCAALALLLAGQLIHYNRDALAAHARYGATIRGIYGLFGAPLYPDWPLDAFEVTGTEAIAGRSNQNALDVLANVVVRGQQPIGLPLIRIVLRDRWTNPVASRVFEPHEYLRTFDAKNPLVSPGTALPVEISVADPGAEALGYVVDVCLPRRKTGLECQIAKDPFQ